MNKKVRLGSVLMMATSMMMAGACSDNPASSDANVANVMFTVVTQNTSANNGLNKGADFVTITSARVVIEKIRFESIVDDTLDFRFRQPFVRDLALNNAANVIETVQVPFGTYKESEIEIDDLEPEDGDVYQQNPELQQRSILIKGFLNGDPNQTFVFASHLSEEQEREFDPPLVLDENTPNTSVVLFINMDSWFVDRDGNLLDPRAPANFSVIEDNIKASIEVFEDRDEDGRRDD